MSVRKAYVQYTKKIKFIICLKPAVNNNAKSNSNMLGSLPIEANGNGSLKGIEKITGENVAGAIIEYAEKIGK